MSGNRLKGGEGQLAIVGKARVAVLNSYSKQLHFQNEARLTGSFALVYYSFNILSSTTRLVQGEK